MGSSDLSFRLCWVQGPIEGSCRAGDLLLLNLSGRASLCSEPVFIPAELRRKEARFLRAVAGCTEIGPLVMG